MTIVPVTAVVAVKNEQENLARCLAGLRRAERVIVIDSHSTDQTAHIARDAGVEVVQFDYQGSYPKKRQWALNTLDIRTEWVLLLDADEFVPEALWDEIGRAVTAQNVYCGYFIVKGFHFLGQRFRFGGFSFAAVLLIRQGKARFEETLEEVGDRLDMEVHERMIVNGPIGRLRTPLLHQDFKGLHAYIDRHNRYSTWEAMLRYRFLERGQYGANTIKPRLFGNTQERRRWIKRFLIRLPGEQWIWFLYHYVFRLGILEGRKGLIACSIRSWYISCVRAKVYEIRLRRAEEQ